MVNNSKELKLPRAQRACGQLVLPDSKSISNRALLLAAMASGQTVLEGVLEADDTEVMIDSLQRMGIVAKRLAPSRYEISGDWFDLNASSTLFVRNAGTAMRTLTAALAWAGGKCTLSGIERMHVRPIKDLVHALQQAGARIDYMQNEGYPPLKIHPSVYQSGHVFEVKGNVSSQFLTALLMAAPQLTVNAKQAVKIRVIGKLISQPYIAITLAMMADFGVQVAHQNWQEFTIPAGAYYRSPGTYQVEGDASSASYFLALGAVGGGPVQINGVGSASVQGDIQFADLIQAMGGTVLKQANSITVEGLKVAKGQRLHAFNERFDLIPDAAMTAAALAMYADGPCMLRDIGSWRVKEPDRIEAMQNELRRLGAQVASGK